MKKITMVVLMAGLFVAAKPVLSDEAQLRQMIESLQQENAEIKQQQQEYADKFNKILDDSAVAQELAMDLDKQSHSDVKLSGYADIEFTHSSIDGENAGFRLHHFSLFVTKNLSERWRLFAEVEYEDAPNFNYSGGTCTDCDGKIFLEAMNLDYVYKPGLNFKAGRFYAPAGIWSTNYYPPFVPTQKRPAHIRKIFPQLVDGVMLYGNPRLSNSFLNYNIYLGNGESNSGARDDNSSKAFGLRLSTVYKDFELGTSFYRDKLGSGLELNTVKSVSGLHAKMKLSNLSFQSEYSYGQFERENGQEYDKDGYYAQIFYTVNQYLAGYRYDRFVDYDAGALERKKQLIHSVFVNYHLNKDVVLKLEHHIVDSTFSADYNSSILSLVAYLGE